MMFESDCAEKEQPIIERLKEQHALLRQKLMQYAGVDNWQKMDRYTYGFNRISMYIYDKEFSKSPFVYLPRRSKNREKAIIQMIEFANRGARMKSEKEEVKDGEV